MPAIHLPSFAKVNIGLFIKGKRPDGFHEVETLLQQITLHDQIKFELCRSGAYSLTCNSREVPTDSSNLCIRAVRAIARVSGERFGINIHLHKTIPVGAGLGGGSSNAAVALIGTSKLLQLPYDAAKLRAMGAELGSDVPFFVEGGLCLATGRGERLEPFGNHLPDRTVLVVFPALSISTRWAYENLNLDLTKNRKNVTLASFKDRNFNELDLYQRAVNDFENVVFARYPSLSRLKRRLLSAGAIYASLSGSGSALFGVFERESVAIKARDSLPDRYVTFVTRFTQWGLSHVD